MSLSNDLVSQFVKMTNDNAKKNNGKTTTYGSVVEYDGNMYVKLDGSDLLTPVDSSSTLHENDRVLVDIGGHNATVSGNLTSPSVSKVEIIETEDTLRYEFAEGITKLELVFMDELAKMELRFKDGYNEGIVSFNKDGVQVSHTAYDGYTKMSNNGFYINDGKNDVLKCNKDGLVYTGTITGSAINGGTISIGGNFAVSNKGTLTTNSQIIAQGGLYTYQDIRGMDNTADTGGLTLVTGVGHLAVRTENSEHSIYLQPGSGEVKVTGPADPDTFKNLRAYNLLANNAVYANGVQVTSDINRKRDIELYEVDALAEICSTPVYTYHLDTDLDEELKRIGIIMQEAPLDAIDLTGKGVDLYQMTTMLWKAVQQLNEKLGR